MNSKINAALHEIFKAFDTGKIPEAVALSVFPPANTPSAKWSLLNRTIIHLSGTADARGFQQWKKVGRKVKKGAKALYIFAPRMVKEKEEGEEKVLAGFLMIPVFRAEDTEGEALDYEKIELPRLPLEEVARSWGIEVKAIPGNGEYYGYYNATRKVIGLATEDESVFFPGGQDPWQEIVAELSAQALCLIVGKTSRHLGSAYRYIGKYAQELNVSPELACVKVLAEVEAVLDLILNPPTTALVLPSRPEISGSGEKAARVYFKEAQIKPCLTTRDLESLLVGNRIKLDCGHYATPGHNLSNTLVIYSEGGGKIKTMCHECYD
jgi:hypothetical protein